MKTFNLFALVVAAFNGMPLKGAILQVHTGDNLQAKIDAAVDGDTVYIRGHSFSENITINGKAIRLIAEDRTLPTITGTVTISNAPANSKVILKNLHLTQGITCGETSLNLIRCKVDLAVNCPNPNTGGNPQACCLSV